MKRSPVHIAAVLTAVVAIYFGHPILAGLIILAVVLS